MTLFQWRTKHELTQHAVADRLAQICGKRPSQRTVCYWDHGTMPQPFWREQIRRLTGDTVRFT